MLGTPRLRSLLKVGRVDRFLSAIDGTMIAAAFSYSGRSPLKRPGIPRHRVRFFFPMRGASVGFSVGPLGRHERCGSGNTFGST
jgi:hypothetical protein